MLNYARILTVTLQAKPVCLCKLRDAHSTPTFKTEALHLVSNVQLVKGLVLRNEQLIQHYCALLQ